ncbi:MAG: hypothetical protein JXB38_22890 [Anaerolineales bacterium]|nr:hypothetical protein [Anaerolineales bacterium]
MLQAYHAQIIQQALGETFSPRALETITAANLRQDDFLTGQIGHPEYHFDANRFAESYAYIEAQRAIILDMFNGGGEVVPAWEAFGRLTHTAQDFYAHSNYVRMWVGRFPEGELPGPEQIEALDETLLDSPDLRSGEIYAIEVLAYFPVLRPLMLRLLPKDAHGHMNLDDPSKGPLFPYAIAAAVKRTTHEYATVAEALSELELARFWDNA